MYVLLNCYFLMLLFGHGRRSWSSYPYPDIHVHNMYFYYKYVQKCNTYVRSTCMSHTCTVGVHVLSVHIQHFCSPVREPAHAPLQYSHQEHLSKFTRFSSAAFTQCISVRTNNTYKFNMHVLYMYMHVLFMNIFHMLALL